MSSIFRGYRSFWILFIWALQFSANNVCIGLLEVYDKECQGSTTGLTHLNKDQHERYEDYRRQYENCTLIRDNLEIVFLQDSDTQYDFSFLESIREVNGYVLIVDNHVNRIRLNGLRIIRGWRTYSREIDNVAQSFSLYVVGNHKKNDSSIGLKELQLTSLLEILNGSVYFGDNAQLCFAETRINWTYINQNNPKGKVIFDSTEKKRACDRTCHENCTIGGGRFCWGEGPTMCQAERPCMTCRRNCPANSCFCSSECIGGCTGYDESSCVACKNFVKDARCVGNCNEAKYNLHTNKFDSPPTTYMFGSKCVAQCPENMLIQNEACVTKCIAGYMENKTINDQKCVKCEDGKCPKTCSGTTDWIHGDNLAQFNQCTKVEGSLKINNNSFVGHSVGPKIQLDHLEILKDVDEITGILEVDAWHENLTSLSFLRNLRVIGGIGADPESLIIMMTPLRTIDLKFLRQIKKGNVVIFKNFNLCYAHTINWTRISTSKDAAQEIFVLRNANLSACEEQGRACSELCSGFGCWGPGDDNCVSCRNYSMMGRCLTNCTREHGFYAFTKEDGVLECGKCHKECLLECTGEGPDKCKSCRNVNDNGVCLPECPENQYSDLNRTCQWCDGRCKGCTGNSSHLGVFGCNNCQQGLLLIKNETEKYCMQNETECDKTQFWSNEFVETKDHRVQMKTCRKCHPECNRCENGNKSTNCINCHNYKQTISHDQEKFECVSNCSYDNGYYYVGNSTCKPCAPECRHCQGPTKYDYDCQLCKEHHYRIRVSPTEEDLEKKSYKSYCDNRCPPDKPNTNRNADDTESHCAVVLADKSTSETKSTATIFVVSFLVLFIAIVIVILGVFLRRQKLRRLKESVLANDEIPMISATKAKPDMSMLRLIKESELRRGNMIGSGAFGTVYKGVWLPEKENIKIPVAIKVLLESSNTSQNVELLDEARIMASVNHPNCVRILAVCMTAQLMLISQLMPLGCLLDYVRKEKANIGSRALLLWSVQIAKGMQYLESLGIVHRDLAARNVLVHSPSQVRITDFGLAKLLDYEEAAIHSEGGKMPIKWLALECIQHRIYTHKSDVWSYAVTLWEMFTYGDRPYENLPARQTPKALENGERLPQPPICTIDVYMILIKCWMLDVDSRPTFSDLSNEFTKMAQDPGRFLMIQGDTLMRLPSCAPNTSDLIRMMSLMQFDELDYKVVSGEEYLPPMDLDSSFYLPATSPLAHLTSIPEDNTYENTQHLNNSKEHDDDLESPSRNGKSKIQYLREQSQRYIDDPCRGDAGQKKDDSVDEDGYLPTHETTTAPSYLDVVYSAENDSTYSNGNQNHLDNKQQQQQQYLVMRSSIGFSKDNPDYYEDDPENVTDAGNAGGSSEDIGLGGSEKT